MKRKHFLLVLLLLSVNFWYIKPIGSFFASSYSLFVSLAFILGGGVYFYNKTKRPLLLWNAGYNKPLLWIAAGVLLSFIPAYINYGQSFSTSFIASRIMLLYLTFPTLLIVRPRFKDIQWALYIFSFFYFATAFFDSILNLHIITPIEGITFKKNMDYIEEGGYIHFMEGVYFIGFAFIISLGRLRTQFTLRKLFISIFLFGLIFIVQNRSTLFPCSIFFIFTFLSIKQRKYRHLIRGILFFTIVLLFLNTIQEWDMLLEETNQQIGNKEYNRNLAIYYFIYEACPHWWEYLLGNGFISAKSTSIMQDMMEQGVFNSDVGFVGFWNQYGIIPIVAFVIIIIKAIYKRKYSFITKCNAWFIVACSLTAAYFAQDCKILWWCLFLYLISVEHFINTRRDIKKKHHILNK